MVTNTIHKNGVAIVEPPRNIMGEAIAPLRQTLTKQIDRSKVPRIVIDFGRVQKMDSSGLGTLVNVYCMAKAKNGRICVINVGRNIKSLIVRSRLINFFEHFENEDDALSALRRFL